jgi:AraC family transcriptional regulator, transcriptional activator of pobA
LSLGQGGVFYVYLNFAIALSLMKNIHSTTLEEFYQDAALKMGRDISSLLPPNIDREIGHFNIFDVAETIAMVKQKSVMPYNRRAYYKISLIQGRNIAEYADKVIDIKENALLFATPKVPYHWIPMDESLSGHFCIFTGEFMTRSKTGIELDELPIFQPGGFPVFQVGAAEAAEIAGVFRKMHTCIASDYAFKYDLLRNYVMELIHYGQKLQPAAVTHPRLNASARVTTLFIELLERQFPIDSSGQRLKLRTPIDFADRLSIHVNHLNKALKENTGNTTTTIIAGRVMQEAKVLLKQTEWNISEIAYCLGFEEVAHFSNFFRKHTALTPLAFRANG